MPYKLRKRGTVYHADISVDGVRRRMSLGLHDRHEAMLKAAGIEHDLRRGKVDETIALEQKKLSEFIDEYIPFATSHKKPSTVAGEKCALNQLKEYVGADRCIGGITARDVDGFLASVKRRMVFDSVSNTEHPVKNTSANSLMRTLRAAFSYAERWQYTSGNPFNMKRLPEQNTPPRILSTTEVAGILKQACEKYPMLADAFLFLYLTGLRRSELTGLKWDAIDEAQRLVKLYSTKTGRYRGVTLGSRELAILQARHGMSRPFPYSGSFLTHTFKQSAIAAGILDASLHSLRKSSISEATGRGIPTEVMSQRFGNSEEVRRVHYLGLTENARKDLDRVADELTAKVSEN